MTQIPLPSIVDTRRYVFGCKHQAIFTIVSLQTQTRFTYRVRRAPEKQNFLFADVFVGPDNEHDYQFMGTVRKNSYGWTFVRSEKSSIPVHHNGVIGFDWFVTRLNYPNREFNPNRLQVFYSGTCSNCGKCLTTPESLQRGLGPKCFAKANNRL